MYYLTFFIDYRPFLEEKLKSFISEKFSDIWLQIGTEKHPFRSLQDLPSFHVYPLQSWYLHGSSFNKPTCEFPGLPLDKGTSLEHIDALLSWFANSFSWSIFPWGGFEQFASFAFVSKNSELRDQFLDDSSNTMDVKSRFTTIPECNLLISNYDIKTDFSKVVQTLLVDDFEEPGSRIWDACECDSAPPWVITMLTSNISDEDFFRIYPPEPESTIYWERADYHPVQILDVITEEKEPYKVFPLRFGVNQPGDRQSFIEMCNSIRQGEDMLVVIPSDSENSALINLLAKIESKYSKYSDLSYIQDILGSTRWFYGLNRDQGDQMYSVFVSRETKLLQRIDQLKRNDGYILISCF